ncbi:FtsW/RodA/SpoVE family cell cycle protein [Aureispira anguillae]|uniref:Probable peptidoglycan glycosyltransferase FtsW n=1 Tax=Aureispira anguillae TaxID=2864201 RepID=A0A915YGR4_9BACT|nr:FtsW/RodA/SpoVE family cell cycle protein [Aureispira anguillae]BDS12853.1 FtsW/RodA/SpoVE family cell cycle protein [Aureispira anguillae]
MDVKFIQTKVGALLQGDKVIWLVIGLLAIFSVLTVYSSAEALALRTGVDTESFLVKHIVLLCAAMLLIYICHMVNYVKYGRLSVIFLVIAVPLLVYTQLLGETLNQATRWIKIPFIGVTFQTSDFAKIALIMYTARTLSLMQSKKVALGELIIPVLLVCGLIAPSDLSSALILFFTCVLLMFIGRVEMRNVFSLMMLGVGAFAILIMLSEFFPDSIRVGTWISRLRDFWLGTTGDQFQVEQAQMAIAQGGFLGVGPGNAQQAHFLPHSYSDYIFCVIVEEYGTVGAMVIIGLYITLLLRCIRLVTRSPKAFGAMLALGLCFSLVIQAFVHMAVNVNLLPVTGLTLPFVSMGGTSLLFTGISLGIILSVSKYIETSVGEGSKTNDANQVALDS